MTRPLFQNVLTALGPGFKVKRSKKSHPPGPRVNRWKRGEGSTKGITERPREIVKGAQGRIPFEGATGMQGAFNRQVS